MFPLLSVSIKWLYPRAAIVYRFTRSSYRASALRSSAASLILAIENVSNTGTVVFLKAWTTIKSHSYQMKLHSLMIFHVLSARISPFIFWGQYRSWWKVSIWRWTWLAVTYGLDFEANILGVNCFWELSIFCSQFSVTVFVCLVKNLKNQTANPMFRKFSIPCAPTNRWKLNG